MDILEIKVSILHTFQPISRKFHFLMTSTSLMSLTFDLRSPKNPVAMTLSYDIRFDSYDIRFDILYDNPDTFSVSVAHPIIHTFLKIFRRQTQIVMTSTFFLVTFKSYVSFQNV